MSAADQTVIAMAMDGTAWVRTGPATDWPAEAAAIERRRGRAAQRPTSGARGKVGNVAKRYQLVPVEVTCALTGSRLTVLALGAEIPHNGPAEQDDGAPDWSDYR